MIEKIHPTTIRCLQILRNKPKDKIFRDSHHIFGVVIVNDKDFPERNGIIIYGPNNAENCQAFILGMKEIMHRKEEDEMIVQWVNIRQMLKQLEYQEVMGLT